MAYIVTVQDPSTGQRRRLEVAGGTTAEAIVEAGRTAPGMRVLDVRPRGEAAPDGLGEAEGVDIEEPPPASPAEADLRGAATTEATIQWRRARRPALPYVATLLIGVGAGGAGALWLTNGFDTLADRARALTSDAEAAPSAEATPAEAPLTAVHATDDANPVGRASIDEASLPPETHRIADAANGGATVYRVISEDKATGYLYETLVRADTADEAAAWCAARTRMEIVRVERVADAPG